MKPTRNTNSDDAFTQIYQAALSTQSTRLAEWVARNWQKMFPPPPKIT